MKKEKKKVSDDSLLSGHFEFREQAVLGLTLEAWFLEALLSQKLQV
jgi:hypothetical protein